MPFLARLYIKTALLFLAATLALAVAAAAVPLAGGSSVQVHIWPSYLHLLMLGWLTQLIFGVAFWLFPRVSREQPYGHTWPVAAAWPALNGGLLLRLIVEPGLIPTGAQRAWLLALAAALQWLAVMLLVGYTWRRVKVK